MKNEIIKKEQELNNFKISNDLVRCVGLIKYTLMELRLLFYCIQMVKTTDKKQKEYFIDFNTFKNIIGLKKDNYTQIKKAFQKLSDKSVWYSFKDKPKEECLIRALNDIKLSVGKKIAYFKFSEGMEKMIFAENHFVLTMACNILCLKHEDTQLLYLYLRSFLSQGQANISYIKLKPMLSEEKKYKYLKDWKRWVLIPAIKEINQYTDIYIEFEEEGFYQEDKTIYFTIRLNDNNKDKWLQVDKNKKYVPTKKKKKSIQEQGKQLKEDISKWERNVISLENWGNK